ncbi:MAG: GreA/GreB family elongation factor [Bacteroidetes bacterium]|nr:GreA/GreB family elongation factor [Bacteroidota bacterium]
MDKEKLGIAVEALLLEKKLKLISLIEDMRASNNDTKSSMGDKYETGREMLQQEINQLQWQLSEIVKQEQTLLQTPKKSTDKVEKGAVVTTDSGCFFLCASLGEIIFDQMKIYCISPDAPLAQAMMGKKVGDSYRLNNRLYTILQIE